MLNEPDAAYSRCIRCQTCDGFPCLAHAKSDAEVISVRPALERPNVTLLRNGRALRLETNAAGTAVTGVLAEVSGAPERFEADIVVVSCGAANSAALLLRSASDKHPAGLANGSGQVGRNYMFHNSQAVLALSLTSNDTMFQKTLRRAPRLFSKPVQISACFLQILTCGFPFEEKTIFRAAQALERSRR